MGAVNKSGDMDNKAILIYERGSTMNGFTPINNPPITSVTSHQNTEQVKATNRNFDKVTAATEAKSSSSVSGMTEPSKKRFVCDLGACTRSFTRKYDLDRHMTFPHTDKPYACEIPGCEKDFPRKNELKRHFETLHNGENHQCTIDDCTKSFNRKDNLISHKRRIHHVDAQVE